MLLLIHNAEAEPATMRKEGERVVADEEEGSAAREGPVQHDGLRHRREIRNNSHHTGALRRHTMEGGRGAWRCHGWLSRSACDAVRWYGCDRAATRLGGWQKCDRGLWGPNDMGQALKTKKEKLSDMLLPFAVLP